MRQPLLNVYIKMSYKSVRWRTIDGFSAFEWNEIGFSLNNAEKHEEAIECYNNALKLEPIFPEAWNNKVRSLRKINKFDEAMRCLNRAIEIRPDYANAWYNKGMLFALIDEFDKARKCFLKVLEIDPHDEDARRILNKLGITGV